MSSLPVLETARLRLYLPEPEEAAAARAFFVDNRAHLEPWEPPLAPDFFTLEYWRERLARSRAEVEQDKSCRFMLRRRDDARGPFVGVVGFTNYSRGPHQACNLGYSISAAEQGKGLMREALVAAIAHAFGPLGFHRVQAGYQPANERSGRLLKSLGFVVEGYARDYLFVGGAWRDHILTALVNPDPRPPPPPSPVVAR